MQLAVVGLCLGMMMFAWYMRRVALLFMSLLCWMGFTAYMYSLGTAAWDYYRVFAWVGIGMSAMTVFQIISVRVHSGPEPEPEVDPTVAMWQRQDEMHRQINMMRGRGIPPRRIAKRTR